MERRHKVRRPHHRVDDVKRHGIHLSSRQRNEELQDSDRSGIYCAKKHYYGREKGYSSKPEIPLSADDGFIENWLARAERETNREYSRQPLSSNPYVVAQADHMPRIEKLEDGSPIRGRSGKNLDGGVLVDANIGRQPGRKRKYSTDSSLLDAIVIPASLRAGAEQQPRQHWEHKSGLGSPNKRRHIETAESLSPSSVSSKSASSGLKKAKQTHELFERRPRHKTRENLYEVKDKKQKSNQPLMARKKSKSQKKNDRKKATRKANEELMQTFTSKSIDQERLSLRPCSGIGIFNNGRTSTASRLQGLPDLAFSEMDFLRNARHSRLVKDPQPAPTPRNKEKRAAEREREEISSFFRRDREPLQETHGNALKSQTPKQRCKRASLRSISPSGRQESEIERDPISNYVDLTQQPFLGFGKKCSHSGNLSYSSRGAIPSHSHSENISSTDGRRLQRETTYISWSESHHSTGLKSDGQYRQTETPTPESVRKSIAQTGVLKDTGINQGQRTSHHHAISMGHEAFINSLSRSKKRCTKPDNEPIVESATQSLSFATLPKTGAGDTRICHHGPENENQQQHVLPAPVAAGRQESDCRYSAVKAFEPKSGWIGHRDEIPANSDPLGNQEVSFSIGKIRSTPISREDIAKRVRIERPSTTVPVLQGNYDNSAVGLTQTPQSEPLQGQRATQLDDQSSATKDRTEKVTLTGPQPSEFITASTMSRMKDAELPYELDMGQHPMTIRRNQKQVLQRSSLPAERFVRELQPSYDEGMTFTNEANKVTQNAPLRAWDSERPMAPLSHDWAPLETIEASIYDSSIGQQNSDKGGLERNLGNGEPEICSSAQYGDSYTYREQYQHLPFQLDTIPEEPYLEDIQQHQSECIVQEPEYYNVYGDHRRRFHQDHQDTTQFTHGAVPINEQFTPIDHLVTSIRPYHQQASIAALGMDDVEYEYDQGFDIDQASFPGFWKPRYQY
ncbi:hypothetical protein BP6252_09237 [Coleophoma cylindrospora]|uniref:Uncharacterized protein n=1 Tax=Coleophoma cylindrospora TaxID=1849047 RepID=A0A3D8R1P3_9HELO|nr:hypothetical protein BP6252_09237 [Coleophoma cylindrospora]